MRKVWLAAALALAGPAQAEVVSARYGAPTDRYPHAVLGDDVEYGTLTLELGSGETRVFTLPRSRVFEDTAPRLADLDGDGDAEVIVVESDNRLGAALVVYDETGPIAQTPPIGTRFRWLAVVGAADLDGDGAVEIAYVDRPHLAKTLRVWRWTDKGLIEIASLPGVTNHRIGEPDIAGGIRDCGQGPEMIVADAGWKDVLSVSLEDGELRTQALRSHNGRASFAAVLDCSETR